MENGDIPDENIQASSEHSNYPACNARLNGIFPWIGYYEDEPWIQADIGYQTYMSGIVIQGGGYTDWVTSFKVSTFFMSINDSEIFVTDENGSVMVSLYLKKPFFHPT